MSSERCPFIHRKPRSCRSQHNFLVSAVKLLCMSVDKRLNILMYSVEHTCHWSPLCVVKGAFMHKSLDVYNYALCAGWNTSLLGYWTFSSHHFCDSHSLLHNSSSSFPLTISPSSIVCFSATCLYTHLKMAITEVLMTQRAEIVISLIPLLSLSLPVSVSTSLSCWLLHCRDFRGWW